MFKDIKKINNKLAIFGTK